MTQGPLIDLKIKAPPLIKWPGGKRSLLPAILPLLPSSFGRYFEPFVGSGALFFALQPRRANLSDTNEDLINLYIQVRDHPAKIIQALDTYKNSKTFYYKIRAQAPRTPVSRAARLLFLLNLSFNGIHRVNLRGQFNVPYGYKIHRPTHDAALIETSSLALATAKLRAADFSIATASADKSDLVYFDPPYTVAHAHNGFVKYNETIFSWDDQIRLATHAHELAGRGCHVFVSNADHPSVRRLYAGFRVAVIKRYSVIAASSQYRRQISEALYYKPGK